MLALRLFLETSSNNNNNRKIIILAFLFFFFGDRWLVTFEFLTFIDPVLSKWSRPFIYFTNISSDFCCCCCCHSFFIMELVHTLLRCSCRVQKYIYRPNNTRPVTRIDVFVIDLFGRSQYVNSYTHFWRFNDLVWSAQWRILLTNSD